MFLNEFVGHAFGFPDCHPLFLGLRSFAILGFQVDAFCVWLGFLVLWWFENWIVDASKMRDFFWFRFFCFYQFQPAPFVGVA